LLKAINITLSLQKHILVSYTQMELDFLFASDSYFLCWNRYFGCLWPFKLCIPTCNVGM